jgi:hypothetical protein
VIESEASWTHADWHLSPEQSLFLHAEKTVIPTPVIIHSSKGTNHRISLLFGTSLSTI